MPLLLLSKLQCLGMVRLKSFDLSPHALCVQHALVLRNCQLLLEAGFFLIQPGMTYNVISCGRREILPKEQQWWGALAQRRGILGGSGRKGIGGGSGLG